MRLLRFAHNDEFIKTILTCDHKATFSKIVQVDLNLSNHSDADIFEPADFFLVNTITIASAIITTANISK